MRVISDNKHYPEYERTANEIHIVGRIRWSRGRSEVIGFREIDDADPVLAFSPLVRGVEKTFAWIGEYGGIPLRPSKAFKRVFVHWAAAAFE
ncbi:hypothetical protein ruthe_01725 [Rubellimicrobium thermophilum DSM 16684]|uniref:Uncharacterized protein n=1 Tax=Rubellimicrobium thermophilum DSM 16684 TaxID=1123069 RepID=S9S5J9_9RHOB|nr:hypothetical protein [Rubellimicrobium thermophilum]EPX85465.1 hypothetical protein ruthe_01725 [Rubellimicrobium thermophilum DSM 16684]